MPHQAATRLILIRHGESEVTVRQVLGGQKSCTGLSDLGRRQAEALCDRWVAGGEPGVDALYSSTLPRAVETAEILNNALGDLELTQYADLEEHRPGDADGVPFAELEERFGPLDFRTRPFSPLAPNAESGQEFFQRTARSLEQVLGENIGNTVVVACHGGVIEIALRYFLDWPRRAAFDTWTFNTSITELLVDDSQIQRGRWRLVRYNDHAHLAGLPAETVPGSRH